MVRTVRDSIDLLGLYNCIQGYEGTFNCVWYRLIRLCLPFVARILVNGAFFPFFPVMDLSPWNLTINRG